MGPGWDGEKPFPLLVKWLDCRERLSLQVHPPARVAGELGGEPKTENWYIADAEPDAALIVGLKRGVSREQFEKALREERLEDCLHRFTVEPGQSVFVPSGRLHAIDAGNLILEIQQNSDTTYRVYDWGRTGLDGKPRELHLEQSLKSIDWGDEEPRPIPAGGTETVLADAEPFRLTRRALDPRESLAFAANEQPHVLSVVSGALEETSDGPLRRGENVLLPFAEAFTFTATEPATVLITDRFSGPAT
jgi:mannose-6-phosphate isomerase